MLPASWSSGIRTTKTFICHEPPWGSFFFCIPSYTPPEIWRIDTAIKWWVPWNMYISPASTLWRHLWGRQFREIRGRFFHRRLWYQKSCLFSFLVGQDSSTWGSSCRWKVEMVQDRTGFTTWMWKSNLSSYKNHPFFCSKGLGLKDGRGETVCADLVSGILGGEICLRCSPLRSSFHPGDAARFVGQPPVLEIRGRIDSTVKIRGFKVPKKLEATSLAWILVVGVVVFFLSGA